ncbi:UvrD-helicase domain-containing protein, partial [Mariniphaga sediminis]
MIFDYLKDLNKAQQEAVVTTEGPALIIAGAGSGKTRVLTYRISHLLKQGARPSSILALTFTNKAAKEMKERIAAVVGENTARYLWMGTFHSVFARMLRTEHEVIG